MKMILSIFPRMPVALFPGVVELVGPSDDPPPLYRSSYQLRRNSNLEVGSHDELINEAPRSLQLLELQHAAQQKLEMQSDSFDS